MSFKSIEKTLKKIQWLKHWYSFSQRLSLINLNLFVVPMIGETLGKT